jgi:hypothetical protein
MDKPKSEMSFDELVALNHPPELEEDDPVVVSVPGPPPGAAAQAPATAPAAPASPAAPATAEAKDGDEANLTSHDRKLVRALRNVERRQQTEIERLKAENEALKKVAPAPASDETDLDEETMEDLKEFSPKVARFVEKAKQVMSAKPPAAAPAQAEFEPVPLPPGVKELVEDNPDLFDWHQSPEHADKWAAAEAADLMLRNTPEWKGKGKESVPARLAAAVDLVKKQYSAAPPPPPAAPAPPTKPTAADAKALIDKAADQPLSVDDLRGRTPPTHTPSNRAGWKDKSNDEILAGLMDESGRVPR